MPDEMKDMKRSFLFEHVGNRYNAHSIGHELDLDELLLFHFNKRPSDNFFFFDYVESGKAWDRNQYSQGGIDRQTTIGIGDSQIPNDRRLDPGSQKTIFRRVVK